jgi:hypothetical protein
MKKNLLRISKADSLLVKKTTLYKWHHLKKFPQLFLKLSGFLFIDLDELEKLLESKSGKA